MDHGIRCSATASGTHEFLSIEKAGWRSRTGSSRVPEILQQLAVAIYEHQCVQTRTIR